MKGYTWMFFIVLSVIFFSILLISAIITRLRIEIKKYREGANTKRDIVEEGDNITGKKSSEYENQVLDTYSQHQQLIQDAFYPQKMPGKSSPKATKSKEGENVQNGKKETKE